MTVQKDPAYDFVPPLKEIPGWDNQCAPRGRQCGQCGAKFDYGVSYGYYCANTRCPMGWGSSSGTRIFERPGSAGF